MYYRINITNYHVKCYFSDTKEPLPLLPSFAPARLSDPKHVLPLLLPPLLLPQQGWGDATGVDTSLAISVWQ